MRPIQQIFDVVIDAGLYTAKDPWMCFSLRRARDKGLITLFECTCAREEIKKYLRTLGLFDSLSFSLFHRGLRSDYQARLQIYRNWANRPMKPTFWQRILSSIKRLCKLN